MESNEEFKQHFNFFCNKYNIDEETKEYLKPIVYIFYLLGAITQLEKATRSVKNGINRNDQTTTS